ncbi:hypothetical protein QTP86_029289 [Hemibagrus guttatus]|nr:hypothetical protein QTP86_029289 [Hemibagrus guttatus]
MFRRSSDDVNVIMEVVVGFIGKLVDDTVHKTIIRKFPNQKPWVDKTVHDALRSHSAVYNSGLASGNMDEYKAASYSVRRVFKEVKWCYGKILEMVNADTSLADEPNTFYTHFEAAAHSANGVSSANSTIGSTHPENNLGARREKGIQESEYKEDCKTSRHHGHPSVESGQFPVPKCSHHAEPVMVLSHQHPGEEDPAVSLPSQTPKGLNCPQRC